MNKIARQVSDLNVVKTETLLSPAELCTDVPRTDSQADFVGESRDEIQNIIFGEDNRFLLIIGPCSIHDPEACKAYAKKLKALSDEVKDRILIVMRVYFEKPRTSLGWKGLIMDPHLNDTNDIPTGLHMARGILREILDIGLPTATEFLDPITPQYIADLVSWSAIGARTSESQTHRQMASGLSMPLGFKNDTHGDLTPAINAIKAANGRQTFLGVDQQGKASVAKFVDKRDINYPVLLAKSQTTRDFGGIYGIPVAFLVNQSGNVVKKYTGYVQHDILEKDIRSLLN